MKEVCNSVGLSYFGHITRRQDSLEKTMMLGKTEGNRKRGKTSRWIDCTKEAIGRSLQELSTAAEAVDITHFRVAMRQSQLKGK